MVEEETEVAESCATRPLPVNRLSFFSFLLELVENRE